MCRTPEGITYTSVDGAQWTQENSTPSISGDGDIAFADAGFVLVDFKRILTSVDGADGQVRHELEDTWFWRGIVVSGGRTVCLAEQNSDNAQIHPGMAVASVDGISWQESPMPTGSSSRRLFSDESTIFAIWSRSILTSPDGITWTEHFSRWVGSMGCKGFEGVSPRPARRQANPLLRLDRTADTYGRLGRDLPRAGMPHGE